MAEQMVVEKAVQRVVWRAGHWAGLMVARRGLQRAVMKALK